MVKRSFDQANLQNWLFSAYLNPDLFESFYIAKPGYSLPSLEGMVWQKLDENINSANVAVNCDATNQNNWLIAPEGWEPPHRLNIFLHPYACNNIILMGNDKIYGEVYFYQRGGLAVFSENTGHASFLSLRFWGMDELFFWGKDCTSNGTNVVLQGTGKSIIVGDDCMFANGIFLRNSDMHGMMDMNSGEWLNPPGDIHIEPHVWVAQDALIMKNTHIGFGSVIGAKALVNSNIPRFSLAAGAPAKIIKTDVSWDRMESPQPQTIANLKEFEAKLGLFQ